jgi:hypothetical protein
MRFSMANATLTVAPTQWAHLKDIHDVDPVNDSDLPCLAAVREVLKKHGRQDRFGVALLHKHFDMGEDEILVEETDVAGRVLTIKPVKQATAGKTIETIWHLADGEQRAMLGCRQYCGLDVHGNHSSFHKQT